jgi:RNA polymerase sigma-70 factor (ECF subfamily)
MTEDPAKWSPAEAGRDRPREAQLSGPERVSTSVSSVALEGNALAKLASGRPSGISATVATAQIDYTTLSDADVMLRVKAGDDVAFDYLVQKFRRPLVGFMYRMAHNQAVAEELAQEVFLRVYRSRETYNAEAKFSTWLYRIATNLAVNHARDTRQERPETSVSIDETDEESGLGLDVADATPNVEQNILRRERLAAIRKHVDALPERQKLAVVMHKYQEMDYRQIAAVLKLSESATKSLLFRAYETLRERLREFV